MPKVARQRITRGGTAGRRDPRHEGAPGGGRRRARCRSCSDPIPSSCRCRTAFPTGISTGTAGPLGRHAREQRRSHRLIARAHPGERVIGCVVYPATELHRAGRRSSTSRAIASRSASRTARRASACKRVSRVFRPRRTASRRSCRDIRAEIWLKLWGNMTFNPISALTRRDAGRHMPVPADAARWRAAMMTRGAGDRRQARHHVPRADRKAHRRRREGRPPQDLDAAGRRGRARHWRSTRCWARWSSWRG